jgi:cysteine desulfurase
LEEEGFEVTYLPVAHSTGIIDLEVLKQAMRPDTLMVSAIHVNNEIGVMQPIK